MNTSSNRVSLGKVRSLAEAVALVPDGAVVAIQGSGGGIAEPTRLLRGIRERFESTGAPSGLTLLHSTGLGDTRSGCGTDVLALPGLIRRDIAGHLGMAPLTNRMIQEDQIESYNYPQGVLTHLYGAIAGRRPGVITKIGLETYVDPAIEGGCMNASAKKAGPLVRRIELDGETFLYWPSFPIHVALVRGTVADTQGNISCDEEAALLEGILIAQAAKASGGLVIAQVKYLADRRTIHPRDVRIPGICVDHVVVDPDQKQTVEGVYDPSLAGNVRIPMDAIAPLPPGVRKIVARRAAKELFPGAVVNLGYGMPDGVAAVAAEEGLLEHTTFTVEQGLVGGKPSGGVIFGSSHNPQAMLQSDYQFNFYDGGNLDVAFLGMAQVDRLGNVNVSKVGGMLAGCGGFINITQNARKVVYCGTFTAKGLDVRCEGGSLRIECEGSVQKFVDSVEQITFSGPLASRSHHPVLYVTERAVFELRQGGVVLTEIAPGIDMERDLFARMGFVPVVDQNLKTMDQELFQ